MFYFYSQGKEGMPLHSQNRETLLSAEGGEEETLAMATRLGKGTSVASEGRERECVREREREREEGRERECCVSPWVTFGGAAGGAAAVEAAEESLALFASFRLN